MRPGLACCWLCREIQGWERERRKRQVRGKRTSWDRQACQDFPFRKAKSLQSAQIRTRSGFLKERGLSRSSQRISRKFLSRRKFMQRQFREQPLETLGLGSARRPTGDEDCLGSAGGGAHSRCPAEQGRPLSEDAPSPKCSSGSPGRPAGTRSAAGTRASAPSLQVAEE